jgi:hypothetical protein
VDLITSWRWQPIYAAKPPECKMGVYCRPTYNHKSASLVKCVAELCGIDAPLGEKGQSGILENTTLRDLSYNAPSLVSVLFIAKILFMAKPSRDLVRYFKLSLTQTRQFPFD